MGAIRKLELADIADLRAYERERDALLASVIALKRRRRVGVGPFVSMVFECRETVRFQVQEMARAERMGTDAEILAELEAYNPLVPDPGELVATLFIELTSREELETWLPRLVGIERSVRLRLPDSSVVSAAPDEGHASQLSREDVTASVHYVRFRLAPREIEATRTGSVALGIEHPAYTHWTELSEETRAELLADLGPL